MKCSLQNPCWVGLFLALLLSPERVTAQESHGAAPAVATAQPGTDPELADFIPLTTVLSGRLASLEKLIADQGDHSRVEQQLKDLSATVDGDVGQFSALKAA